MSQNGQSSPRNLDVIVIGAGAAGLMCAAEAGKRGRRVLLLDHAAEIGKKILISGGGRCNFTNLHCKPENFLCSNPHFHKSALARYTAFDFVALVERHGIRYHEKTLGQLFCNGSAREIVKLLRSECEAGKVEVESNCRVFEVRRTTQFVVDSTSGTFSAPALVIATGGLSIPRMGATAFGYNVARQFGIRVVPCIPALVPLTFSERDRACFAGLAGVATPVVTSFGSQRFRERLLFTHRGLSGPAVLQISSYWDRTSPIGVDLLPTADLAADILYRRQAGDKLAVKTILAEYVPRRLAERWLDFHPELTSRTPELEHSLHHWAVMPSGTEGFEKAEVTVGGVHPDELSSKTMEARTVPGLFFIGEVVDVTGHLGGFNFQWAWSSGWVAGQAV